MRARRPRSRRSSRSRPRSPRSRSSCASWSSRSAALLVEWRQIIVFLSVASMVLGAVAAIAQTNIKRLMAYSSIGHVGYALIGLAAATPNGIRGVLVYMAIYLFMNLGTLAVILCMRQQGQDGRGHRRSRRAVAHPAGAGAGARHLHVLDGRHPAARRVLRASSTSSSPPSTRTWSGSPSSASSPASSARSITCASSR